jgi:hypothetical protein
MGSKTQSKRLSRKLTAPGSLAADAPTAGRAAPLVLQRAARALRLRRHASQLALFERVPPGSPAHLVQLPPAAQPEEPAHGLGLVRGSDRMPALAPTSDHPPLGATSGPMPVASRKSRVRESRLPGAVRAKPNGRATRPQPALSSLRRRVAHSVITRRPPAKPAAFA